MKFDANTNYTILSNSIDKKLLEKFSEYNIMNDDISYNELKEKIENYLSKVIVFNDVLRKFNRREKNKIIDLVNKRNVHFINITSSIEETLLGDYIFVFDKDNIVIEGNTSVVLKEEKLLKRLGFGLPFVVDLSTQLTCYDVLDKLYYDVESLVDDLWT